MTEFDPVYALGVMKRLQQQKNREAADLYSERFDLLMQGKIGYYGYAYAEFDRRIKDLWRQADSYDSVIKYLEQRIEDEKTPVQRVWDEIKDYPLDIFEPNWLRERVVRDVLQAANRLDIDLATV